MGWFMQGQHSISVTRGTDEQAATATIGSLAKISLVTRGSVDGDARYTRALWKICDLNHVSSFSRENIINCQ